MQHRIKASLGFKEFVVEVCSRGAAAGHGLVKCFERDHGVSYESQEAAFQHDMGVTVQKRMTSRVNAWGIRKWQCHRDIRQQDMEEVMELLQTIINTDEAELPKVKAWQLRRILAGWPAKAGLGVDAWVIRLWANLPDEALRSLILLIYI